MSPSNVRAGYWGLGLQQALLIMPGCSHDSNTDASVVVVPRWESLSVAQPVRELLLVTVVGTRPRQLSMSC